MIVFSVSLRYIQVFLFLGVQVSTRQEHLKTKTLEYIF